MSSELLAALILIAAVLVCLAVLFFLKRVQGDMCNRRAAYQRKGGSRCSSCRSVPTTPSYAPPKKRFSSGLALNPKSSKAVSRQEKQLYNHLLRLLKGDHHAIERLVTQNQLRNPDRSRLWLYEKVIWDLERDRRF